MLPLDFSEGDICCHQPQNLTVQSTATATQAKARGGSIMQPLAKAAIEGAPVEVEPGTSAFAALATADVKPDAVFFHKFYSAKVSWRSSYGIQH